MATIQEIIQKQAAAVKQGSNAIKAAEALEQAARFLRADVEKPKALSFRQMAEDKRKRSHRFMDAYAKSKDKEFGQALTAAGWVATPSDPKTWQKKGSSLKLSMNGRTFTVVNGTHVVVAAIDLTLENLKGYLNKPVTQKSTI